MTIEKTFDNHEDLNDNEVGFLNDINQLSELGYELENFIHQETSDSDGEIINEIVQLITEHENMNRNYHEAYKIIMRNKAKDYELLIMDMNNQKVTLHYQVIKMNES